MLSLVLAMSLAVRGELDSTQSEQGMQIRMTRANRLQAASGVSALFRLLPLSGAGADSINDDLCTKYAGELAGNYTCLRGNGTQASSASGTLAAVGTPLGDSQTVCPSGPSCASVSLRRFNNTWRYATPAKGGPAGNFSSCAVVRKSTTGSGVMAVQDDGGQSRLHSLQFSGSTPLLYLWDSTGTAFGVAAPSAMTLGTWGFICGTYERLGQGTSVMRLYIDGLLVNTNSAAGLMRTDNSAAFQVGGEATANFLVGDVRTAFFTEKTLSQATIQAMAADVFPALKGSQGEALTFARNSTAMCEGADGSLTLLGAHRPCWTAKGLAIRNSATNVLLRSYELNNAAWTTFNATVTADVAAAPDGTFTADRITDDGSTTSHVAYQSLARTSGTQYTASVYAQPGTRTWVGLETGSGVVSYANLSTCVAGTAGTGVSLTVTPSALGFCRISATWTASATASANVAVGPASGNGGASYTGTGAGAIVAWGLQANTGGVARYVPTQGTAASSNAEDVSIPNPIPTGSSWAILGDYFRDDGVWDGRSFFHLNAGVPLIYQDINSGLLGCKAATNDYKYFVGTAPLSGQSLTGIGCSTTGVALTTVLVGGQAFNANPDGPGDATLNPQPNTLYIGGTSSKLDGWVKNFCVAAKKETCL